MRFDPLIFCRSAALAIGVTAFCQAALAVAPTAIESVSLSAAHPQVRLPIALKNGQLYLLKATGVLRNGKNVLDAEYLNGADFIGKADVGVDVGLPAPRNAPGRMKWFGGYRKDHSYAMIVTGAGRPLDLRLIGAGGKGSITVAVMPLSGKALGKPLESLKVSVMEVKEYSKLVTKPSTVYLLECAGQGRVGGGGLGMGDADYMDYRADGAGHEDIGDRNTDYGLGIDEANQDITPRKRWWGPFRLDHDYFMLFEGTGKPIQFFYYDVKGGYGDNSPTDRLKVNIFKLP
jgi:hypothetical protein